MLIHKVANGLCIASLLVVFAATLLIASWVDEFSILIWLALCAMYALYSLPAAAALMFCRRPLDRSEIAVWVCAGTMGLLCLATSIGLGPGLIYFPAALVLVAAAITRSLAQGRDSAARRPSDP
jgi:hypothetical protein